MDVKKVNILNGKISNCDQLIAEKKKCHGSVKASPLMDSPNNIQSIMLITRDPSNNANNKNTLVGFDNDFFIRQILPLFYSNYDISKCENSINYFNIFKTHFHENVYWTHYAKCFPGLNEKNHNHNRPNNYCAKTYLYDELKTCNPKLSILIGDDIIFFLTGYKTKDLILNIDVKTFSCDGKKYKYLFSTHPSNANAYKGRYKFNDTKEIIQEKYRSEVGLPNVTNIDDRIINAVFDCVYTRDDVAEETRKIYFANENKHLFNEIDILVEKIIKEYDFEEFKNMYSIVNPIIGPMEINSEGTNAWLARCIAIKIILQFDDENFLDIIEKIKIIK